MLRHFRNLLLRFTALAQKTWYVWFGWVIWELIKDAVFGSVNKWIGRQSGQIGMILNSAMNWITLDGITGLSGWLFLIFVATLLFISWRDTRIKPAPLKGDGVYDPKVTQYPATPEQKRQAEKLRPSLGLHEKLLLREIVERPITERAQISRVYKQLGFSDTNIAVQTLLDRNLLVQTRDQKIKVNDGAIKEIEIIMLSIFELKVLAEEGIILEEVPTPYGLNLRLINRKSHDKISDCYIFIEQMMLWSQEDKKFMYRERFGNRNSYHFPMKLKGPTDLWPGVKHDFEFLHSMAPDNRSLVFNPQLEGSTPLRWEEAGTWRADIQIRIGDKLFRQHVWFSWKHGELPEFAHSPEILNYPST